MNLSQLRKIDFTLLLIFQAVMKHRQLTAAAEELDLTQSALSHALKRLRGVVGQDLFVRRQLGMEPTEAARRLIGPVDDILQTASQALSPEPPFDPLTSRRQFRVAANELATILFASALADALAAHAPAATVSFLSLDRETTRTMLEDQEIDLAVSSATAAPERITATPFLYTGYSAVARKGGPLRKKLNLKKYLGADHVRVSPDGDPFGAVEHALADGGHVRHVAVDVPDYATALRIAAETDCVATVPTAIAATLAKPMGLRAYPTPVDIRPITLSLLRHERRAKDDGVDWLVGEIEAIAVRYVGLTI